MRNNNVLIPPGYSACGWSDMAHSERIKALHEWSKNPTIGYNVALDIKDEISYYVNIRSQITTLTGSV